MLRVEKSLLPVKKIEGMSMELSGTIQTEVMAIGGETTGSILTTDKGESYELLLDDKKFPSTIFENGSRVKVKGILNYVSGVEIQTRAILTVSEISVDVQ